MILWHWRVIKKRQKLQRKEEGGRAGRRARKVGREILEREGTPEDVSPKVCA